MRNKKSNKNLSGGMQNVFDAVEQTYGGSEKLRKGLKILPDSTMGKVLIGLFIATDMTFLYQLINIYFTNSMFMTAVTALIAAAIIDVIPSIIAGLFGEKNKKPKHYGIIIGCTVILFVMFGVLFAIRYFSSGSLYQVSDNSLNIVSGTLNMGESVSKDTVQGQLAMTILFGIIPVGTSIISFAIGICENKETDDSFATRKLQSLLLKSSLIDVDGNIRELESELSRDLKTYDEENEKLVMDDVKQYGNILRERAKLDIAMKNEDITVLNYKPKKKEEAV